MSTRFVDFNPVISFYSPVLRYMGGGNGSCQNCMSVRFNAAGTHILALRRRQNPVLYAVHDPYPVALFYHQDYYNSCTMKSCTFAGEGDQFVLSGSDDFNLYMWKIPEGASDSEYSPALLFKLISAGFLCLFFLTTKNLIYCFVWRSIGNHHAICMWTWNIGRSFTNWFTVSDVMVAPHIVLFGHRSIVNQVRYNPHYCLIASSGVEKIIKVGKSF